MEWAASAKIPISMGPLIDLTAGHFPDWLLHWVGDLPNLAAFFSDFLATLIARYKDRRDLVPCGQQSDRAPYRITDTNDTPWNRFGNSKIKYSGIFRMT